MDNRKYKYNVELFNKGTDYCSCSIFTDDPTEIHDLINEHLWSHDIRVFLEILEINSPDFEELVDRELVQLF